MKNALLILSFCLSATIVNGQTELKANPIALLFETFSFGVEQVFTKDLGLDADVLGNGDGFYLTIASKFYFNPKLKADGFHIGLFTGFGSDLGGGIGFLAGYKWLSKNRVVFELGAGIGTGIGIEEVVPYFKLHTGYRFNRNKEQTKIDF